MWLFHSQLIFSIGTGRRGDILCGYAEPRFIARHRAKKFLIASTEKIKIMFYFLPPKNCISFNISYAK